MNNSFEILQCNMYDHLQSIHTYEGWEIRIKAHVVLEYVESNLYVQFLLYLIAADGFLLLLLALEYVEFCWTYAILIDIIHEYKKGKRIWTIFMNCSMNNPPKSVTCIQCIN